MEPSGTDLPGANTTNEASSSADATVPPPDLADFFAETALTEDRVAGRSDAFLGLTYTHYNIELNQRLDSYQNRPHRSNQMYEGFALVADRWYIPSMFVHSHDYSKTFNGLLLKNLPKSYGELIDCSDGSGKVFQWDMLCESLHKVKFTYMAYSHVSEDSLPRTIFELSTLRGGNIAPVSEPVGHGKISIFWHDNFSSSPHSTISIQSMAYLLGNLRTCHEDIYNHWLLRAVTKEMPLSNSFLFAPSLQTRPDLYRSALITTMPSRPDMEFGFRMAYLGSLPPRYLNEQSPKTGMMVRRTSAKLSTLDDFIEREFKTTVMVIAAVLSPTPNCPYQISAFVDCIRPRYLATKDKDFDEMPQKATWQAFGLRSCGRCAGVGQFLCLAMLFFIRWEKGWMDTLDKIDGSVSFELADTLDEDKLDNLMFDESFRRSKLYFTILQLLRSSSNMVQETRREWIKLHEAWIKQVDVPGTLFSRDDLEAASENWKVANKAIDAARDRIDERVTRKTEEIKSLRDGLFNATALREATKSIALNRAIYVFTVVTVIYTPIGFLAAFWALPFFQRPAGNSSTNDQFLVPRGFIATFIVVPILTYLIAMLVAFSLGYSGAERRLFKERAFKYCRPIIKFYRKIIPNRRGSEQGSLSDFSSSSSC